jgi:hypothetical protein
MNVLKVCYTQCTVQLKSWPGTDSPKQKAQKAQEHEIRY